MAVIRKQGRGLQIGDVYKERGMTIGTVQSVNHDDTVNVTTADFGTGSFYYGQPGEYDISFTDISTWDAPGVKKAPRGTYDFIIEELDRVIDDVKERKFTKEQFISYLEQVKGEIKNAKREATS